MRQSSGRCQFRLALARNVPGGYGALLRRRILTPHLGYAGNGVHYGQGIMIRNPQMIRLGDRAQVGDGVFLQGGGGLTIGNDVLLGPGVKIWTQNHVFRDPEVPILDQGAEYADVTIEDDCWLGANVFVMPGVHLPRGCVVAAGSVVGTKQYRPYQILMGFPARPIGSRQTEA
jgi:acetyltransferase-like isoleucine patch superfamily enzyme